MYYYKFKVFYDEVEDFVRDVDVLANTNFEEFHLFQHCPMIFQQRRDPLVMPGFDHDPKQLMAADRGGKVRIRRFHGIETAGPGFRIDRPAQIHTALFTPFGGESVTQFARRPAGRE